jgi:hypothetical protein
MEKDNLQKNKSNLPFGIKPISTKALTSFQKSLTVYIILNLFVIIAGSIFISKISKKIESSSGLISAFKENQTGANALMEYIARLEKDNKLIEDDFTKYQSLLIDIEDIPAVKKQIVDIGIRNKVDPLLSILTLNPSKEREQVSYGFVLSISGSFDRIIKTFKDINNLKIFITFDQITFEKNLPKNVEKALEESSIPKTDGSTTTTKTTPKRTTTTKPTDVFKVSVIGKIYLKENLKTQNNELNK